MKILLTGSHFTPAQAVIPHFKKIPSIEVVYLGRAYTREGDKSPSMESQMVPAMGVKFISLTTGRLQRSFTRYTIPSLLKIPFGLCQAFYLLSQQKPDVVVSFGGYVAVPVVLAAWLLSIPVIIHEQTLVPGLANQISRLFASKIAISFDQRNWKKDPRIILTGNPLREEILQPRKISGELAKFVSQIRNSDLPLLLITGGNQGSHIINQTVHAVLKEVTNHFYIVHQTGDSKYQDYEKLLENKGKLPKAERYFVCKWLDATEMGSLLPHLDLIATRGGINTLLEVANAAIPALVIPIPYVAKDEQMINANYFHDLGLAQVLSQSELTESSIIDQLLKMKKNLAQLKKLAKEAQKIVIKDAAERLVLETLLLANKQTKS
ncbi:UDP-N-acetylglucosamine--N-acetylmuramyl-(pentapeptide) pyrophosphoryl-undecaprenol N-acetylglucosamine transferase [Patescibacteria group bacterium]|nr:UDP-N-acetylglucosamine--N-acetylmuramyl-(pentapeptide) pyrophosphoryl-undecaprenol N-acetylglucosamine transferase [Patescibacteria group bacterium]MCL5410106.1 UDP-N-acetylglucosamine--N-acetylmuramyl-(pentapeptide) pyrophosphoryl-undecaprenol N-acetylglucosamine transferase [Patescibacteria group bacterium]